MAVIQTSTDRSRFGSIPRVRGNGYVNAQDIAAGSPAVGQLGDALQRAGHVGMGIATDIRRTQAQAESANAMSAAMQEIGEGRNRIGSMTGTNAFNATKDMEKLTKTVFEKYRGQLKDSLAQEWFDRGMLSFNRQYAVWADGHVITQTEAARKTGLAAMQQTLIDDAAGDTGIFIGGAIQQIKEINTQLYAGQPQEFIDLKNREMALLAIDKKASVLASKHGPEAALGLINSGIEMEFTTHDDQSTVTPGISTDGESETSETPNQRAFNANLMLCGKST